APDPAARSARRRVPAHSARGTSGTTDESRARCHTECTVVRGSPPKDHALPRQDRLGRVAAEAIIKEDEVAGSSDRKARAAAAAPRGVRILEVEAAMREVVVEVDLAVLEIEEALRIAEDADAVRLEDLVIGGGPGIQVHRVGEARASAALHADAQAPV